MCAVKSRGESRVERQKIWCCMEGEVRKYWQQLRPSLFDRGVLFDVDLVWMVSESVWQPGSISRGQRVDQRV